MVRWVTKKLSFDPAQ